MSIITVIGSKGLLGSNLCKLAATIGHKVEPLDVEELDISDTAFLSGWIPKSDWVVNCAAITDIDAAEEKLAKESLLVNGAAPEMLAAACKKAGVGFIHVSTDYVFFGDGLGSGIASRYQESDEPAPRCRYGIHKLMGEMGAEHHGGYVLRTAWLYGPGGKNFVSKSFDIATRRQKVAVDNIAVSSPTLATNLAANILAIVAEDERKTGGLYHCADEGEVTRWEVFDMVRRSLGLSETDWVVEQGPMYTAAAPRPLRTPLDSSAFFLRFANAKPVLIRAAVEEYVSQCKAILDHA
jgi:dTDP-4-dehydrorhamnose reductase